MKYKSHVTLSFEAAQPRKITAISAIIIIIFQPFRTIFSLSLPVIASECHKESDLSNY